MPHKKMISSKKTVAKTTQTKAEFVLAQDPKLSAPEVVARAKVAGFELTGHRVHNIRWKARQQKGGNAKPAGQAARLAKVATPAVKPSRKPATKSEYVLGFPPGTPAADIVAEGKSRGIKLSVAHVYAIRTAAKARGKKGKAPSAPAKIVRTMGKMVPGNVGRASGIAGIHALDLAYAVGRLIAAGTTTAAEVAHLAAERTARIESLEAHLAALKGGQVPVAEMTIVVRPVKAPRPKKTVANRAAKAKTAVKPVAQPRRTKAKAVKGKVTTRIDGRKFTMTAKALAARKLQGTYLGHLRQVPEIEKPAFKTIAKEEGVAAAVAELKKRLGKE